MAGSRENAESLVTAFETSVATGERRTDSLDKSYEKALCAIYEVEEALKTTLTDLRERMITAMTKVKR